ncbi:hypothetical protein [Brevibacterium luteolum]|nr:hypothetical protein [Brevibacterium luteolum]MBM7530068.1 hypothetical protein [Brevibacterium luteolum]
MYDVIVIAIALVACLAVGELISTQCGVGKIHLPALHQSVGAA